MTRTKTHDLPLLPTLEALISLHGLRRVILATFRALLIRPRHRPLAARFHPLDDHIRRDIGLPCRGQAPPRPDWQHLGW